MMSFGQRGAAFAGSSLLALLLAFVSMFLRIGEIHTDIDNVRVDASMTLWSTCMQFRMCGGVPLQDFNSTMGEEAVALAADLAPHLLPSDLFGNHNNTLVVGVEAAEGGSEEDGCFEQRMCADPSFYNECPRAVAMMVAARVFGIAAILSHVPSIVLGLLDVTGKLPKCAARCCCSTRFFLIFKALSSLAVALVYASLSLSVWFVPACAVNVDDVPSRVGLLPYFAFSSVFFTFVSLAVACVMKPSRKAEEAEEISLEMRRRRWKSQHRGSPGSDEAQQSPTQQQQQQQQHRDPYRADILNKEYRR